MWILLAMLAAVAYAVPGAVRSDGTLSGSRELYLQLVFGTMCAIIYVAALAIGCGLFARDREKHYLPLALVRPTGAFAIAFGKWLALSGASAVLLTASCAMILFSAPFDIAAFRCRHHASPRLMPVEVAAARAMDAFLASDKTPAAAKKASRAALLSLLTAKENERHEVIHVNGIWCADFEIPNVDDVSVRVRFATMYGLKEVAKGTFSFAGLSGSISNDTQAIIEVPMSGMRGEGKKLEFRNQGKGNLLLRPRKDIELVYPADSFCMNLLRAASEAFSVAALLAAFGIFLSAGLSKPVALFTAFTLLVAALAAPDAVSQFPDEFNATATEKLSLAMSRAVVWLTSFANATSPVSDLAKGRAIECLPLGQSLLGGAIVLPTIFLALAALVVCRKSH